MALLMESVKVRGLKTDLSNSEIVYVLMKQFGTSSDGGVLCVIIIVKKQSLETKVEETIGGKSSQWTRQFVYECKYLHIRDICIQIQPSK